MAKVTEFVFNVNDSAIASAIIKIGQLASKSDALKKQSEELTGNLKGLSSQVKQNNDSFQKYSAQLAAVNAAMSASNEALAQHLASLKADGAEAVNTENSYAGIKARMQELAQEAENLNLKSADARKRFKEIQVSLDELGTKAAAFEQALNNPAEEILFWGEGINEQMDNAKEAIEATASAFNALTGAGSPEFFKEYEGAINKAEQAFKGLEVGMSAYNAVTKITAAVTAAYTTVQSGAIVVTNGLQTAVRAMQAAFMANPIGLIIGGIAAAVAVLAVAFGDSKEEAEDFIKTLDEENAKSSERIKQKEREIELLRAQGASEAEVIGATISMLEEKDRIQTESMAKLKEQMVDSSDAAREVLQKRYDEMKAQHEDYVNEIKIQEAQLIASKEQLNQSFKDEMAKLDEEIANLQNTGHRDILLAKQQREIEYLEANFKDHEHYEDLLEKLKKSHLLEVSNFEKNLANENSPLKKLNSEISKLTDQVLNQLIARGEASASKISQLKEATEKLRMAQEKLNQALKPDTSNEDKERIEGQISMLREQLKREKELIDNSILETADKKKKANEAEYSAIEKEMELYKQLIWLDGEFDVLERTQLATMEQQLQILQQQINAESEYANIKKSEGSELEQENARYQERLVAFGIYGIATEQLTTEQKAILEKLEEEHQDKVLGILQDRGSKEVSLIQKDAEQQLTLLDLKHQEELNKDGKSHKQRKKEEQDFQNDKLAIQKEATQKQIDLLEKSLKEIGEAVGENGIEGLDEETKLKIQDITIEIQKLKGEMAGLNDGGPERNVQIQENAQKAADAFGKVNEALDMAEQISEVRLQNELARIDEKRQAEIDAVNGSVLSEEQKKSQIDAINAKYDKEAEEKKKAAAKREKAFAITKTIIAGAQAVAQGIAQFGPPPSPPGIAAIAAAAVTTATQLALIAKQKFAKGGVIPFETGGMIQGALHAQGGVPFLSSGNMMEAEGGELIVNRNIWSRPDFVKNISEMNALTGGKRFFAAGGVVPTVSPPGYVSSFSAQAETLDSDLLVKGLRGVIAEEVGSLKIVNNVVDTTSQQQRLLNIQTEANF